MKKIIFVSLVAVLATFSITGCNTGDVSVGGTGAAPSTVPGASTASGTGSRAADNPASDAPVATQILSFEQTRTDSADNTTVLGIAFQAEGGSVSSPAEIPLRTEQNLPAYPAFGHSGSEIHYLYSPRFSKDSLIGIPTDTMEAQTLYTFPERVLDFTVNPQGDKVAWIDSAGKVFVSGLPQGWTESLGLEKTTPATKTQWDSTGQQLLVLAGKGALLFTQNDGAWSSIWQTADATAAALGPEGHSIAYVKSDGKP